MSEMASGPDESSRRIVLAPPTPEEVLEGPDSLAEQIALESGLNLKSERTKRELDRLLRMGRVETHLHRVVVVGLYIVALSAAAMFLAVVWHYITPWAFLSDHQLSDVKQLLFSGAVGAAVSGLAKKYLGLGGDNHKD